MDLFLTIMEEVEEKIILIKNHSIFFYNHGSMPIRKPSIGFHYTFINFFNYYFNYYNRSNNFKRK